MKKNIAKKTLSIIFIVICFVLCLFIFINNDTTKDNTDSSVFSRNIRCVAEISYLNPISASFFDQDNFNVDSSKKIGDYTYNLKGADAKLHVHGYTNRDCYGTQAVVSGNSLSKDTGDVKFGASTKNTKYQVCYSANSSYYHAYLNVSGDVPSFSNWTSSDGIISWEDSGKLTNVKSHNTETTKDTYCSAQLVIMPELFVQYFYSSYTGALLSSKSVYYRCTSKFPNVEVPTGYKFDGWYRSESNSPSTPKIFISSSQSAEFICDGKAYYVAKFSPIECTIELNKQNGSGGSSSVTATYGSAMPAITTPSRTGYSFQGYYTGTNGSGTKYYDNNGKSVRNWDKTSNTTLYAYWTANGYTLTADVNEPNTGTFLNKVGWTLPSGWSSSSDKSYATKTVNYDSTYGTLPTPSREGYTFEDWYDASSGGNKISSSNNNNVMNSTSGKTIYAHWTAKSYTLTANANGGSIPSTSGWTGTGNTSTKSVKYDSTYGTLPTPTRTGYTFAGWYTASSGGDTVSTSTKMDNISGKTIYAHWTVNTYSIVFDKNGGSGNMSNQSMTYDKASNLTTNTYTRQGYYFVGWSKTKLGVQSTIPTSNIYKDGESVKNLVASGSITLYAVWLDTWANHVTTPTGSGSSTSPYIIDSAEDLAWMINNHGSALKYFKQTKAINLSKYNWYPIGTSNKPFKGVYNGQGYEITNLNILEITNASGNKIQSDIGLFGYTSGGEITGIYIKNATIYGKDNVGLIVSNATSTKINSNIIESSTINASGNYGAVAGKISGGEIKYNLVYVKTNGGTSTSSLYTGSTTLSTNLVENNGTRSKVGTEDITGWGKVFNRLLPSAISWGAKVTPATSSDLTNWVDKKID